MRARGDLRHHAAIGLHARRSATARRWRGFRRGRPRRGAPPRRRSRRRSSRCRERAFLSCPGARHIYGCRPPSTVRSRDAIHDCASARAAARSRWRRPHGARLHLRGAWLARGAIAIEVIRTSGDRIQDRPLAEAGGKGLFTKEIEEALLAGAHRPRGAFGEGHADGAARRADACGVPAARGCARRLHQPQGRELADLPQGAVVGTASLRRQAMVQRLRPDLRVVPLRGNVETRLRKLDAGEVDATLLALAGLKRLGLADKATALLDAEEFLPAVGQGAITIEARDRRCAHARAAGDDRSCGHERGACVRARVPGRARRLVPHADRRACGARGRAICVSRHDPAAGRQRGLRDEPRGQRARCGGARRGRGRGTEAPRAAPISSRLTCACSSRGRNPMRSRTAERAARARTRGAGRAAAAIAADRSATSRGPYDAVLMTSANAARALAAHPRADELTRLPCFTVGARTAEAARAAGFARCRVGGWRARRSRATGRGAIRRPSRAAALSRGRGPRGRSRRRTRRHGIAVDTVVIYRAVAAERLPPESAQALSARALDGALHYSRRSAATLLRARRGGRRA